MTAHHVKTDSHLIYAPMSSDCVSSNSLTAFLYFRISLLARLKAYMRNHNVRAIMPTVFDFPDGNSIMTAPAVAVKHSQLMICKVNFLRVR